VQTIANIQIPLKAENYLSGRDAATFTRRTLLPGVILVTLYDSFHMYRPLDMFTYKVLYLFTLSLITSKKFFFEFNGN
jgi:hypothetical protein